MTLLGSITDTIVNVVGNVAAYIRQPQDAAPARTDPIEPTNHAESTDSTDPNDPTDPTDPTDGVLPVTPIIPAAPAPPVTPVTRAPVTIFEDDDENGVTNPFDETPCGPRDVLAPPHSPGRMSRFRSVRRDIPKPEDERVARPDFSKGNDMSP